MIPREKPDQLPESDPEAKLIRVWAKDGDETIKVNNMATNNLLIGCGQNLRLIDWDMTVKNGTSILSQLKAGKVY